MGAGVAAVVAVIGPVMSGAAHAGYVSLDTQGTYNTGSTVTPSNGFDLSGDGSAVVTISADGTDDISVSAAAGLINAVQVDGLFLVQPGATLPGPVDSLMDATAGPYYIYAAGYGAGNGSTYSAFDFGQVEYIGFQFTDNGKNLTGYIQGTLDNSVGYIEFSVTDWGYVEPAPEPPVTAAGGADTSPAPEPASLSLLALGAAGAVAMRRRRVPNGTATSLSMST